MLRYCVGRCFGVTIETKFERPVGQPNLLDALTMFSWHVTEPSGWPLRLTVGCIRVTLWLSAIVGPIVIAFLLFAWLKEPRAEIIRKRAPDKRAHKSHGF